jgi:NAD(P)-dependent dehydrogenase (short-subunit alcohol dehydrogenase family)
MTRPSGLRGTVAVVTGGGSGIGRAAALSFARRGARVAVTDLSGARTETVAGEVEALGGEALGLAVDVREEAQLAAARDACLARWGRVDVVMNNVGTLAVGAPESLPDEAWQASFDLNVLSIARSNRVFLPGLLAQGSGHIVNTASASGLLAYGFDRLPYVATKHGIVGLSEALAIYLGPRGIGVTCLCPSGVITNILEQVRVYGEVDQAATPRAPDHRIVEPEIVGELTADAVEAGRFLVLTEPAVGDELRARAADIEAYLAERIAEQVR